MASRVIKYLKAIRNNWKKSTLAAVVLTYGYNYADTYLQTQDLMHEYCLKAVKYGRQPISQNSNPKTITVILNPNANKRKAAKEFEEFCAPILHLAGITVELIKTESEGHAKTLMENLRGTDAIVVAGGDGTLSEVVTGLLRRTAENSNALVPIGVLPLGRSNTVAKSLFPGGKDLKRVRSLLDASLAIVEEETKQVDVMRIEVNSQEEEANKPVYAVSGIKWGAYRDAEVQRDNYWYFGSLRNYVTYLFNGYKNNLTWNCEAQINYSPPCDGCSNCIGQKQEARGWFQRLFVGKSHDPRAGIENEECQNVVEKKISTTDLMLLTSNAIPSSITKETIPRLHLHIGPGSVDYLDFVKQGWKTEREGKRDVKEVIEARKIEIQPSVKVDKEAWFSIDNENFEVKPVSVTLLPKCIKMFCKRPADLV